MRAPVLAVGDGALGFWKALRGVFPDTREQRHCVHKTANVLDAMPKSAQPAAKNAIQDIDNSEDRDHAEQAIKTCAKPYGAKFPKAIKKITDDQDVLLEFFDCPAEHWIHLRTTNPIESTFATVRLRTKVTKGAGSRAAALAMVFKLVESKPAGGPSTAPVLSPWSAPEPASSMACWSDATRRTRHDRSGQASSRPARYPGIRAPNAWMNQSNTGTRLSEADQPLITASG